MKTCKREGCTNPARRSYCSTTCRKADWIARHVPRCPHCGGVITVNLIAGQAVAVEPRRSER